ncbi:MULTISPECIES: haloacid dehalogenase type II [unclassified Paenibacillus]|uniref:haloacid dehalogenase type II n=1 Tax=unclassified Paenibacillus TaxID=185978 RepID=UPI001AE3C90F|nr:MULTISPECIES: haloacid dehalogenase type II [unclassified Paenibacillus]MBP1155653.1 2-haloacid dehalogenase [Paenibacillus sp. PvP091]MBP1168961.1 2-haloacid dehalogenase [Paenibacillus sp. PvR098]MBP2439989.1 2-haloacid dehalogenase [Paenibacillus sp. PvP052]
MQYQLISFDVYSALTDIEGSLVPELNELIDSEIIDTTAFFRAWRTKQWDYLLLNNSLDSEHFKYDYITRCTLEYTAKRFGIEMDDEIRDRLIRAWTRLRTWPEAVKVISEIQHRGYEIAILSNGTEAMLKALQEEIDIQFNYIFASDQAGAYKPSPMIYQLPLTKLGLDKMELLHVAGSSFDVMGAKSAGLTCAWSNRLNDYTLDPRFSPDYEMRDLTGLLQILSP